MTDSETNVMMNECLVFFFNDTATTEIYTRRIVGSVRCVSATGTGCVVEFAGEAVRSLPVEGRMTGLTYTSPSPRDQRGSRMPSSA